MNLDNVLLGACAGYPKAILNDAFSAYPKTALGRKLRKTITIEMLCR